LAHDRLGQKEWTTTLQKLIQIGNEGIKVHRKVSNFQWRWGKVKSHLPKQELRKIFARVFSIKKEVRYQRLSDRLAGRFEWTQRPVHLSTQIPRQTVTWPKSTQSLHNSIMNVGPS
jgi:hypothetical protein